jgi:hypothetical protein
MDYYTNMLGLATDQSIFCEILKQRLPKIGEKISQVGLNAEVFSIQWFVCLFTATIPAQVTYGDTLVGWSCVGSAACRRRPSASQDWDNFTGDVPRGYPCCKIVP